MPNEHSDKTGLAFALYAPEADWRGRAGKRFRKTLEFISGAADEAGVPRPGEMPAKALELGYAKVYGLARKEQAAADKDFSDAKDKRIDAELKERALEHRLRKEKAEADKAEVEAKAALLTLLLKLKEAGVVVQRNENGYLVRPAPDGFDFKLLMESVRALGPEEPSEQETTV